MEIEAIQLFRSADGFNAYRTINFKLGVDSHLCITSFVCPGFLFAQCLVFSVH